MESSPERESVPLAAKESPPSEANDGKHPVKTDTSLSCSSNSKTGRQTESLVTEASEGEQVTTTGSEKPEVVAESSKEPSEKENGNISADLEPVLLDSSDANNTSNETFCSNESSSVVMEDVKEAHVIAESDHDEDQEGQPEDVRSTGGSKSPDLFATQPPDEEPGVGDLKNSAGVMDCDDFIPSSQSVDSTAHGLESFTSGKKDDDSSPLSRKRKLEEESAVKKKLARIEENGLDSVTQTSEPPLEKQPNTSLEDASSKSKSGDSKSDLAGQAVTTGNSNENVPSNADFFPEKEKNGKTGDNVNNNKEIEDSTNGPSASDVTNIESEKAGQSSINRVDNKEAHRRQLRDSLMIVYESPKVSQCLETQDFDRLVSPLQDEDKPAPVKEGEDGNAKFCLYLSPLESSSVETSSRKNCGSKSPAVLQRTPSTKSGSSEHSWNCHNSVNSSGMSEPSTNKFSGSGPRKLTEVLSLDEEDDDLQILPMKQKAAEVATSRSDAVSNGSSSVSLESNDIAVIGDCKSNTTSTQSNKHAVSSLNESMSKPDTLRSFVKQKDGILNSANDKLQVQTTQDAQSANMKRKRASSKNSEVIRIGSDSESEDHSEQLTVKKSRDLSSPEVMHAKHPTKAKLVSTPHHGSAFPFVNSSISSIEITPSQESNLLDSSGQSLEMEKKVYLECRVKVKCNSMNHSIQFWEVIQWEDVTDDLLPPSTTPMICDSSSGADVSKSSSPASVTSCGQFQLKPRHRISTSTTSSGGTSASGSSTASHPRSLESIPFPVPNAAVRILKDKSSSFESSLGKSAFRHLKERELQEKLEKRLQQIVHYERDIGEKIELSDMNPQNGFSQLDTEKKSVERKSTNAAVPTSEKSEMPSLEGKTDEGNTHETMDIQATPKSSKKPNMRSARANRNTSKVSAAKTSQENDSGKKWGADDRGNSSTVSGSARKRGVRAKKANDNHKKAAADGKGEQNRSSGISNEDPSKPRRGRNNATGDASISEGEVTLNWDIETCKTKLVPGAVAFARWTDKRYYPGKIKEKVKDDRWVVEFDDGNVKTLKEEFIIPVNILTKGQVVFALVDDDYEEGIITQFKVLNDEVHYGIEMDHEILFLPRSKLFMTEDQARILQEDVAPQSTAITPKSTSVSVENIVEGKRSRSNRSVIQTTEGPGVSGLSISCAKRANQADAVQDTSGSSSVSDVSEKVSASSFEEVAGVDPEIPNLPEYSFSLQSRSKGPGRIKGKARTARRVASSHDDLENSELARTLGPIPEEGSKLFSGMHFLITNVGVRVPQSSQMSSGSECEDKVFCQFPLVKNYLKRQLEAGGGRVYDHFKDVPRRVYSSCYLLADRPSHSAKYLLCLASGIKILSIEWVVFKCKGIHCETMGCLLPAGWSIEDQKYIDIQCHRKKRKPLSNLVVGFVNESKHFIEFWERVLVPLGAKVQNISSEEDHNFSSVSVIVTDNSCPPEVEDRARVWSIPLLSTTWVKQCLITLEVRRYDGHISYRYDYCPPD